MNEQVTRCHSSLKNEHATDIDISEYEDLFSFDYSDQYDVIFDELFREICGKTENKNHQKTNMITELTGSTNTCNKALMNSIIKDISNQALKEPLNKEQSELNYLNLPKFIQYLSFKITKDENKNITKETLLYLYNYVQHENKLKPLTRDDKHEKQKIYMKLYSYSQIIINCFETNPQKYLTSVILFSNYKKNLHKHNIKRVNYLRSMLKYL